MEIDEGPLTEADGVITIALRSTLVGRSSTAKQVDIVEREIVVEGDVLRYAVRMAAVGQPLTHHLSGELHRDPTG